MWTYNIQNASLDNNGNATVLVQFLKDGSLRFSRLLTIYSVDSLKLQVQSQLDLLTKNEATVAEVNLGVTDLTPTPPTQEELDRQAYAAKRAELIQAKQDLDLGLIDDVAYGSLLGQVSAVKI